MDEGLPQASGSIDRINGYLLQSFNDRFRVFNPHGLLVCDCRSKDEAYAALKILTGYVGIRSGEL